MPVPTYQIYNVLRVYSKKLIEKVEKGRNKPLNRKRQEEMIKKLGVNLALKLNNKLKAKGIVRGKDFLPVKREKNKERSFIYNTLDERGYIKRCEISLENGDLILKQLRKNDDKEI